MPPAHCGLCLARKHWPAVFTSTQCKILKKYVPKFIRPTARRDEPKPPVFQNTLFLSLDPLVNEFGVGSQTLPMYITQLHTERPNLRPLLVCCLGESEHLWNHSLPQIIQSNPEYFQNVSKFMFFDVQGTPHSWNAIQLVTSHCMGTKPDHKSMRIVNSYGDTKTQELHAKNRLKVKKEKTFQLAFQQIWINNLSPEREAKINTLMHEKYYADISQTYRTIFERFSVEINKIKNDTETSIPTKTAVLRGMRDLFEHKKEKNFPYVLIIPRINEALVEINVSADMSKFAAMIGNFM